MNGHAPGGSGRDRAFLLFAGFSCAALAGWWLGLVLAVVSGLVPTGPSRSPLEDLLAAVVAGGALAALCPLVRKAGGAGREPPARARYEGRAARNDLLLVAAFSALQVPYSVVVLNEASPISLFPALVLASLFALASARGSLLLRLAGVVLAGLYALAGVLAVRWWGPSGSEGKGRGSHNRIPRRDVAREASGGRGHPAPATPRIENARAGVG